MYSRNHIATPTNIVRSRTKPLFIGIVVWLAIQLMPGCANIRIPQFDPTGKRIFLPAPNTTTILTPGLVRNSASQPGQVSSPIEPAFVQPADAQPCCGPPPVVTTHRHIIPKPTRYPTRGQSGEIILTPHKIIAPVGSEVVVLAGICGPDSHFVINEPLEWLLSADSVGQFIEIGGMEHPNFNRLVKPSAKKFDGNYAWGRTGIKDRLLTRGTPTPADDIDLLKGQAFVSLSSASEGTSYLTCVAPKAQAWDKRRKSTTIHWIDAIWSIPVPKSATAGTVTPLTTLVTRNTDGSGVEGWKVRYTIVDGAAAEFAPTGSQSAETVTGSDGQGTVLIRQIAGQFEPGTTQVRVDVIRPSIVGEPELQVESCLTSVTWSAPALSIRAIGPQEAGLNQSYNYRIEVSNPGDQVARDVVLRTKNLPDSVEFISSTPKPTVFGRQLEWRLGDIAPGSPAQIVDAQFKSNTLGNVELCFQVSSQSDQLKTEACGQTDITVPCLGMEISGPESGVVGDQARFEIVLVNQCDDRLENVEIQIQYDAGLSATGLGNPIRRPIGSLEPKQRFTVPLFFDILATGRHCFNLVATADGGHAAKAIECLEASPSTSANVDLQLEGLRRVDRGKSVLIRATATNRGNVPLDNVNLTNRFSPSLEPTRVSQQFPHRWIGAAADELIFDLGRLDPGQSKIVEIFYDALQEDGDAFSEMTISSPDLAPIPRRFDLRIEIPGTVGGDEGANLEPGGIDPGVEKTPPVEGPIGIPPDERSEAGRLQLTARTLDRQISVGQQARIEFSLRNDSAQSDTNVSCSIFVPPGTQFIGVVDDAGVPVVLTGRSPDFTRFDLETRREMRPGDVLTFVASVQALQPGQATVEMQTSSDNSSITISANDTIQITP